MCGERRLGPERFGAAKIRSMVSFSAVAALHMASSTMKYEQYEARRANLMRNMGLVRIRFMQDIGACLINGHLLRAPRIGRLARSFRLHSPCYARERIAPSSSMGVALATMPIDETGSSEFRV